MVRERDSEKGTLLARERHLVRTLIVLLPTVALSGLVTWGLPWEGAYWIQVLFLVHAVSGLLVSPVVIVYLGLHFYRTFGNRIFGVFGSGLVTAAAAGGMLVSGLWVALGGQTESTRWVVTLHAVVSTFALIAGIWHVGVHLGRNRCLRRPRAKPTPSVPVGAWVPLAVGLAGFGLFGVMIYGAAHVLNDDELTNEAPAGYSKRYGSSPFAPSETKLTQGGVVEEQALTRASECKTCHSAIYKQWRSSVHSKAALDPAYERNARLLAEKKGVAALRYCEGCHAPVALLGGKLVSGGTHGGMDGVASNRVGVGCVGCHAVESVRHTKGVASYRMGVASPYLFDYPPWGWLKPVNNWIRRMQPTLHRRNFSSKRLGTAKFCATCHAQYMDARMNDWGWVKMQDQYQSWLNGPFSGRHREQVAVEEKKNCQDCHMDEVEVSNGHFGNENPARDTDSKVAGHWFPGANTFVPSATGNEAHVERVREFLSRNKVTVTVNLQENKDVMEGDRHVVESVGSQDEAPVYYFLGQRVEGVILVSNVGVGHKFPAGTNDIHEAWLRIEVKDASGRTVYSAGELNDKGQVPQGAHVYKSVKVDRNGNVVWKHDLFNMVGERYTNVVEPGETDIFEIGFKVPFWAVGPLSVVAELKYRKFNKRYGAWVMKDGSYQAPVTIVGRDALEVGVRERPGAQ